MGLAADRQNALSLGFQFVCGKGDRLVSDFAKPQAIEDSGARAEREKHYWIAVSKCRDASVDAIVDAIAQRQC